MGRTPNPRGMLKLGEQSGPQATGRAASALIHPRAYVGHDVEIGEGTLLAPATLATTRISLGRQVILNVKASVSHGFSSQGATAIVTPAWLDCAPMVTVIGTASPPAALEAMRAFT